jgi:hypothetical protein
LESIACGTWLKVIEYCSEMGDFGRNFHSSDGVRIPRAHPMAVNLPVIYYFISILLPTRYVDFPMAVKIKKLFYTLRKCKGLVLN